MILRSKGDSTSVIMGEAYVHGLTEGQALLGPLPNGISFAYKFSSDSNRFEASYIHNMTGISTTQDPRLEPLPTGFKMLQPPSEYIKGKYEVHGQDNISTIPGSNISKWNGDPRLTSEALKIGGIPITTFKIA